MKKTKEKLFYHLSGVVIGGLLATFIVSHSVLENLKRQDAYLANEVMTYRLSAYSEGWKRASLVWQGKYYQYMQQCAETVAELSDACKGK